MTLDDVCAFFDENGLRGDTPLVIRDDEDRLLTIDGFDINRQGYVVALVTQEVVE